jgi:iron complex transport system substrate-binding protein
MSHPEPFFRSVPRQGGRAMLTRRRTLLLAGLCGVSAGLGWNRALGQTAERVLILGGDLAEIAFALGAGGSVVGTDDTARWPPKAADLPKVGYLRRISAEGVLSLAPDLVLANPAAGPASALAQIESAGVRIETAPPGEDFDTVLARIGFMGRALRREAEARRFAAEVSARMHEVNAALSDVSDAPGVLFLISLASGAPMAGGSETVADTMIRLAHGRNVAAEVSGYKPLSAEAAIGLAPDVLLLPDHAAEGMGSDAAILEAAGLAQTPAGRNGAVIVMDGLKLLGFGPRTPDAVAELARRLHPGLSLDLP